MNKILNFKGGTFVFKNLIENNQEKMVRELQELIKFRSIEDPNKKVLPFGKEIHDALEYILKIGNEMGFYTKSIDGYVGCIEYGEGDETLGILTHIDVVPEGEGWNYPPFSGEIHEGKIYGRGSIDDKGPLMSILYAMKAIKDSKLELNKRIRLIIGTNEETLSEDMAYYLEKETPPDIGFTPDGNFPVIYAEKGILDFDLETKLSDIFLGQGVELTFLKGGTVRNAVPGYCKAILKVNKDNWENTENKIKEFINKNNYDISFEKQSNNFILHSKGKSVHCSTPELGSNAISQLILLLNAVSGTYNSSLSEFISEYCNKIGMNYYGDNFGCYMEDDISGKLTFNVGAIELNEKRIYINAGIRYPVKTQYDEVIEKLQKGLCNLSMKYKEVNHQYPLYVPKDDDLIQKLMKVYRKCTNDFRNEPISIGGGTYARSFKNTVAFGPVFPDQEELAHETNEFIEIKHLMQITEIYAEAMYELAK